MHSSETVNENVEFSDRNIEIFFLDIITFDLSMGFSKWILGLSKFVLTVSVKGESIQTLKLPDKENEMLWCLFLYGSSVWKLVVETR